MPALNPAPPFDPAALSPSSQRALELLLERMPRHPLAGATQRQAERRRWPDPLQALGQRYVQMNLPHRWAVLSLDLDRDPVELAVADAALLRGLRLPWPNIQTTRKGGNHQAHWLLRDPVGRSSLHRVGPQVFAGGVYAKLAYQFGADPGCAGRVMRGLFHPDQTTRVYHADLHDLRGLSALLPPAQRATLGSDTRGRNWQMFLALDRWAAQAVAQGTNPQAPAFAQALQAEAQQLFGQLPQEGHPYTQAELRRTVNSVLTRTRNGTNAKYARVHGLYVPKVEGAALRSRQRSWERAPALPPEVAHQNIREALEIGNRGREVKAARFYLDAAQRLLARGEALTEANMARETGRSARQVRHHAQTWRSAAQEAQQGPAQQAAD